MPRGHLRRVLARENGPDSGGVKVHFALSQTGNRDELGVGRRLLLGNGRQGGVGEDRQVRRAS